MQVLQQLYTSSSPFHLHSPCSSATAQVCTFAGLAALQQLGMNGNRLDTIDLVFATELPSLTSVSLGGTTTVGNALEFSALRALYGNATLVAMGKKK